MSCPQAVEVRPDFRSALFNLALLLSDAGRPLEAVPFLTRLVHHHPDHVKALILLGDIYINNIEDLDGAEKVGAGLSLVPPSVLERRTGEDIMCGGAPRIFSTGGGGGAEISMYSGQEGAKKTTSS